VRYERLVPLLIESIKELTAQRKQDQAQIEYLSQKVARIEAQMGTS
jgi:cell division protein FtsB